MASEYGKEVVEVPKQEGVCWVPRQYCTLDLIELEGGRKEQYKEKKNGQEETPPGTFSDSVAIMQGGS